LARAAADFAQHATTAMLWLYAQNDRWFPPPVATLLADAYQNAGGKLEFVQLPASGNDGHFVFDRPRASQIWGGWLANYINQRNSGS
jgi:dienelactone hydrolase